MNEALYSNEFEQVIRQPFLKTCAGNWRTFIKSRLRFMSDDGILWMLQDTGANWSDDVLEAIKDEHELRQFEKSLFEDKCGNCGR